MSCWADEYRQAHNARMLELRYPPEIIAELTLAREKFLAGAQACCKASQLTGSQT